jgi:hypothetical protein
VQGWRQVLDAVAISPAQSVAVAVAVARPDTGVNGSNWLIRPLKLRNSLLPAPVRNAAPTARKMKWIFACSAASAISCRITKFSPAIAPAAPG